MIPGLIHSHKGNPGSWKIEMICLIVNITQIRPRPLLKQSNKMSKKIIIRVPIHSGETRNSDDKSRNSDDKSRNSDDKSRTRQTRTSDRVKELVSAFAAEHCNDNRILFKEAWSRWIISGEIDSILSLSNTNRDETENKLFFSARYYHRKKTIKTNTIAISALSRIDTIETIDTIEIQQATRAYTKTNRAILQLIDDHLAMLPNDQSGYLIKPSLAFDKFVVLHGYAEYKKTYKNRFYMKETHIIAHQ